MKGRPESQGPGGRWRSKVSTRRSIGPFIAAAALAACGGNKAVQPDSHAQAQTGAPDIHLEKRGDEKVVQYDLNRDGKPDVWDYFVTVKDADGKPVERLSRKEMDLNFDGKVDAVYWYDDKGEKVREQLDLDFDGKVDETIFFEKGQVVRKERDLNGDGKVDTWLFYERGQLVRKERDTKGTGRVDYWEYWENGQIDRIGEDLDGDGNVDRWTRSPESVTSNTPPPATTPSPSK
ncbi:MAG TPA: hypothetical protein VEJ89_04995 [Myxococcaceae bacterium]|jgi:hypothetical protein|nr:hypothetical protein [Myxococcaceae bacterium]